MHNEGRPGSIKHTILYIYF